jgi:two-component system, OmpR family, phosphate regulon sensor histidine kinase PhoR
MLAILVVALAAVDLLVSRVAERNYAATLSRELGAEGRILGLFVDRSPEVIDEKTFRELSRMLRGRLTLIDTRGVVLRDTDASPERMENHRTRPEVQEALKGREGTSIRTSPTLGVPYLYVAMPVKQGVLRLAMPISEIKTKVDDIRRQMLAAMSLAFLPAFILAAFFARYASRKLGAIIDFAGRLADGNFHARLERPGRDELGILGRKLNDTGEKLQRIFEQLEREHQELEKLERVRKDFVINVSHELRTPLASIQGYTETLLDGALHEPEHNVRFLQIIRQNAERLARLTSDLLTLSRIELKTQKFQFASYYVNRLLADGVDVMRPIADKKKVSLIVEGTPGSSEIFCDSESVHQMLSNLIDNAIKYTPENGTVTVGARTFVPSSDNSEFIEFYVTDTGIGIPEVELPRLFERFYRVDKARSREMGGTGLGLAIVKHLAKAQGGEVGVSSQLGHGSTFCFTLPVQDLGLTEYGGVQAELTVP